MINRMRYTEMLNRELTKAAGMHIRMETKDVTRVMSMSA